MLMEFFVILTNIKQFNKQKLFKLQYRVWTKINYINVLSIYIKEQAGTYPVLIENNLLLNNGIYELALCAYSKTTTSVTLNTAIRRIEVNFYKNEIDTVKSDVLKEVNKLDVKYQYEKLGLTKLSNGVFRVNIDYSRIASSLFVIVINNNITISVPGISMFEEVGSEKSYTYNYLGTNYSLFLEYKTSTITLTCGSTSQFINYIYIYK